MRKLILIAAGATVALMVSAVCPAAAKGGPRSGGSGTPPGYRHDSKLGWGSASYPPGFTHGRKRGWRGRSTPPGWSHSHR